MIKNLSLPTSVLPSAGVRIDATTLRFAVVALLAAALTACGGGRGSNPPAAAPTPPPVASVSGAVQKGPFIVGSTVTVNVLTADGANTTSTIATQTTNNFGRFAFTANVGTVVQIAATGFYRNEITGDVSGSSVTLRSIYSVTGASSQHAYVNVLTHLTSDRVLELMVSQRLAISAAIDQAETEFLLQFSQVVPRSGENDFASISIYSDPDTIGAPYLLAVSAIVYRYASDRGLANATNPDAELSLLLNELAADFAKDGVIDMSLAAVRASIPAIDPAEVAANIETWIGTEPSYVAADINQYLDTDLDGAFNSLDDDDDGDGLHDANDPTPHRPNDPVVISGFPPDRVVAGSPYFFRPAVVNVDELTLLFSAANIPPWATLDSATGALSGAPTNLDAGHYAGIRITATSLAGAVTFGPFSIEVVTNPWQSLASMPTARAGPAVVAHDGSIYAIAGIGAGAPESASRYDIATNTWHTLSPMSVPRTQGATAQVLNGSLYLIGGEYIGELASVEAYSLATDTWTPATSMSASRSMHASCVSNGMIYVFGGFTEDGNPASSHAQSLASVEMYDPNLGTWVARSPMPEQNWGMSCVTLNDRIYVFGGAATIDPHPGADAPVAEYSHLYRVYNPLTDVWEASGAMPVGRSYGFVASTVAAKTYLFGGYGPRSPVQLRDSVLHREVSMFDPLTSTWTSKTPLPEGRYRMGGGAWDGKVYLIGGTRSGSNELTTVSRYDPSLDAQ